MSEILIVEDDSVIRKSFAVLFRSEGFAVRTASDGRKGVAAFAERRPDLVLLDVMMPKGNGYAVCGGACVCRCRSGLHCFVHQDVKA